jgi:DNA polymerase elongation subunit (family B)
MSNFYTSIRKYGNNIFHRGYKNGVPFREDVHFKPTLYVPVNKPTDYLSFYDKKYLAPIKYDSMQDAYRAIQEYSNIENIDLHGTEKFEYQFLVEQYPDTVDYDFSQIKILYFDIEVGTDDAESGFPDVSNADQRITAISASINGYFNVFGLQEYNTTQSNVTYHYCENEHKLLNKFLHYWRKEMPDVVTGWNTSTFDLPYLYNRMVIMIGEENAKTLSPFNVVKKKTTQIMKQDYEIIDIFGIELLDYLMLYKFFTFKKRETYKLDFIGHVELGMKKVNYEEEGNLFSLYEKDFQKFIDYSIQDTNIVEQLEQKLGIIRLVADVAYFSHSNFSDTMKQVRNLDNLIMYWLSKKNIIVPPQKIGTKTHKYEGAYVKSPIVGKHKWIVSFDLNSLYPSIQRFLNISPETQAGRKLPGGVEDYLKQKHDTSQFSEYAIAVNGTTYRKDKTGVLPEIITELYDGRSAAKKRQIEAEKMMQNFEKDSIEYKKYEQISKLNKVSQMSRKVSMNSIYGALGSEHGRYYSTDMAEAITITGQFIIRHIGNNVNEYLNNLLKTTDVDRVVASDTDSIYVCMDDLVTRYIPEEVDENKITDFLDKVSETKIQDVIDKSIQEMSNYLHAFEPESMSMSREIIGRVGVFLAKKRYAISVIDSEGVRYKTPKSKIMGMETAKSSTPAVVREYMEKVIYSILNDTEENTQKLIKKFRKDFMSQSVYDISFPRGVNGLHKYYDGSQIYSKGTPIHVRASLLYNHYIRKYKLETKYELILDSDKMKFIFLKLPNPIHENVIGFTNIFPKELGLTEYVDYDYMFQKTFEEPMKSTFDTIGWSMKKSKTMEAFFE